MEFVTVVIVGILFGIGMMFAGLIIQAAIYIFCGFVALCIGIVNWITNLFGRK